MFAKVNGFHIKVELSSSKKVLICLNEGPLKSMKNAFYFNLKALFVLKITIHIMRNISRSKGNQTKKFG